ncbi:Ca2+-binding protein, RTX toxin-related, partial [Aliiroseovarius halocynthiae]
MTKLIFAGTSFGASQQYDSGISDLQIVLDGGQAYLATISASAQGSMIYSVGSDGTLTLSDQVSTGGGAVVSSTPVLETVTHNGATVLMAFGQSDWSISGLTLSVGGQLSNPSTYQWGPDGVGLLTAMHATIIDGVTHVYGASKAGTGFKHYTLEADNEFILQGDYSQQGYQVEPDLIDLETVNFGSHQVLIAASSSGDGIASYLLDENGVPTLVTEHSAETVLPVGTPTALVTGSIGAQNFVVMSSAGSASLTVFKIASSGELVPVDHVIDNKFTRFSDVSELAMVEHQGRLYVIAGGSDDGLSLFTLLPDGSLVHLDTIADTQATALQNIASLEATVVDGKIVVFATSETERGISRFTIDPDQAGNTLSGGISSDVLTGGSNSDTILGGYGDDTLSGGEGSDILCDGAGVDTLSGGEGADVFVMKADGASDTITDFDPTQDRLDLSGYHMLYDASQIQITSASWGATLSYLDEILHIRSVHGGALSTWHFLTENVLTLDRPPSGFNYFPKTVSGTSGNDTLEGNDGRDTLKGLDGDDTLMWSGGGDLFSGGTGADTVSYANAISGVLVNLQTGETDLAAFGDQFSSVENLVGSNFNDTLVGDAGDNHLSGGGGDDILRGGDGADVLAGGAGLDRVSYATSTQGVAISLLDGTGADGDTFVSIEGVIGSSYADDLVGNNDRNHLNGGGGSDTLRGLAGNDVLFGERGDDMLLGGAGDDSLIGGEGNDTLIGGDGADEFIGGAGIDTVDYSAMGSMLVLNLKTGLRAGWSIGDSFASIEVIRATEFDDKIGGSDQRETLFGQGGNDVIYAYSGDDTVWGGDGDDGISGGDGNDVISGDGGDDQLYGDNGNDRLSGGAGDDILIGGYGDDVLVAGAGADFFDGSSGYDTVDMSNNSARAAVNLSLGVGGGSMVGDQFRRIEGLIGTRFGDRFVGDASENKFFGQEGDDVLLGGEGSDKLYGGAQNDHLNGGDGNDFLWGGLGWDKLFG